jgi:trk system potassium uptake protein
MIDPRPVFYVIGLVVAILGATMLVPMSVDLYYGSDDWAVFLTSSVITMVVGGTMAIATANSAGPGLTIRQTFLLTTLIWIALPLFAALPFALGALDARIVDAFFEAMSGMTTTGSTVFSGLDDLPAGLLLWRSMLQWFGGIGIIIVAMVFLPELKVGGMQVFRSEAFDSMGKVLPRAVAIAGQIIWIYFGLTLANALAYLVVGMGPYDAINHALTTMSTGGFSTRDASFGAFQGPAEYVASVFMILASLPFVRYIQIVAGTARPLFSDPQVRAYLAVIFSLTLTMTIFRMVVNADTFEHGFREGLFNVTSIISGTGYASTDYQLWGVFPMVAFFIIGLFGQDLPLPVALRSGESADPQHSFAPRNIHTPLCRAHGGRRRVIVGDGVFRDVRGLSRPAHGGAQPDRARHGHIHFRRGDGAGQRWSGPWRHYRAIGQFRAAQRCRKVAADRGDAGRAAGTALGLRAVHAAVLAGLRRAA